MKPGSAPFLALLAGALLGSGCVHTSDPPVDLQAPGWSIRQGQAVWTRDRRADPVAGELLLATRPDGACVVQFAKPPFTLATARREAGRPTSRDPALRPLTARTHRPWLLLVDALTGRPVRSPWCFTGGSDGDWCLTNAVTGEGVEGYLTP